MSGRHGHRLTDGQQGIAAFRPSLVGARAIVALIVLGVPATAGAFDKAACVDSHESAQRSMKAGRPRESKEQLLVCADSSCPALVREDCEQWLSNLDRQPQPAAPAPAVIEAKGSEPGLEPGPSRATLPPDRATDVGEERDRSSAAAPDQVRSEAPSGNGSPVAGESPPPERPAPPALGTRAGHGRPSPGDDLVQGPAPRRQHALPAAVWVTGGLAVASFGTAASFGVTGWMDARSLRETCAPNCSTARVSSVRQNLLMADIAALTGVAFGAVTAWLIWSHRESDAPEGSKPDARLSASLTGHSFRLDYAASF